MFLLLLDDLAQWLKNGMGEEEKAEIMATFMYTFVGTIMPPYCQARCVLVRGLNTGFTNVVQIDEEDQRRP